MASTPLRASHRYTIYDSSQTKDGVQIISGGVDNIFQNTSAKLKSEYERPVKDNQGGYSRLLDTRFTLHNPPKQKFFRKTTDWPEEYNEDSEVLSEDSDAHYFSSIEEDIRENCTPKQAAGRWRGKGVSKAEYTESATNYVFRPREQQNKDNEEEEGSSGEGNDRGDNGEGGRDPDPSMKADPQTHIDPKAYYGYLFKHDKMPTKVFDAMLRGIAKHIVSHSHLTKDALLMDGFF